MYNVQQKIAGKEDMLKKYFEKKGVDLKRGNPFQIWCHKIYLTKLPTFDPMPQKYSTSVFQNWYKIHFLIHFHVCFSNNRYE